MKKLAFIFGGLFLVAGTTVFAHSGPQLSDGEFEGLEGVSSEGLAAVMSEGRQLPPGQWVGPDGQPGEPVEMLSPEEAAARLTEEMVEVLNLTKKQIKKLKKFNKKDQENLMALYTKGFGGSGGPGGPMGGPGGGPGMGRPGGPMGGPGGGPGGPRPGGRPGGGPGGPGMRPEGGIPMVTPDLSELEEYWTNKELELRKILGDEEFDKWYALHPEKFGVSAEQQEPFDLPQDGSAPFLSPQK